MKLCQTAIVNCGLPKNAYATHSPYKLLILLLKWSMAAQKCEGHGNHKYQKMLEIDSQLICKWHSIIFDK
jgi:hypothetical protein